ncbi:hypothetical protein SH580_14000 [Coraliomargarita algicola]|uniref:Uncharacterized protein n=1 Tax=Coraliomargarita algicola TaxID=3092156 RepID=A0ABZ0REF4_9BACT|nr:hypothetical protein [Coraliomargarita sp. J2-16]WPJ94544.1 hypothetical protein SH580_14000 [Coraliomargarita sp. J2-16]
MKNLNLGHIIIACSILAGFIVHALIEKREAPNATGTLNGAIIFKDGSKTNQVGAGSIVEFYDGYVKASLFPKGTKNKAAEVYPLDLIRQITLKD